MYSYSSSNYSREKFICLKMVCYNYGQKSWDTFAFVGLSLNHTYPTPFPSPIPQTRLEACIQNLSLVSALYRVGGGRNPRLIFSKSLHCFIRTSGHYRKSRITALLSQGLLSSIVGSILVKELNVSLIEVKLGRSI